MPKLKAEWSSYLHKLREKEIRKAFSEGPFSNKTYANVLEIGSGDGFQSVILKEYALHLSCVEYNYQRLKIHASNGIHYSAADARQLPFRNQSFDLIFSSHVLPFLTDQKLAFSEMNRVLKPDGVMLHIVTTSSWKLFNFFLYYVNVFLVLLDGPERRRVMKKLSEIHEEKSAYDENIVNRADSHPRLSFLFPPLLGNFKSHWGEFMSFRKKAWRKLFRENGFEIRAEIPLSLSSGYGFGWNKLRSLGTALGLFSSAAYWVKRVK